MVCDVYLLLFYFFIDIFNNDLWQVIDVWSLIFLWLLGSSYLHYDVTFNLYAVFVRKSLAWFPTFLFILVLGHELLVFKWQAARSRLRGGAVTAFLLLKYYFFLLWAPIMVPQVVWKLNSSDYVKCILFSSHLHRGELNFGRKYRSDRIKVVWHRDILIFKSLLANGWPLFVLKGRMALELKGIHLAKSFSALVSMLHLLADIFPWVLFFVNWTFS